MSIQRRSNKTYSSSVNNTNVGLFFKAVVKERDIIEIFLREMKIIHLSYLDYTF